MLNVTKLKHVCFYLVQESEKLMMKQKWQQRNALIKKGNKIDLTKYVILIESWLACIGINGGMK